MTTDLPEGTWIRTRYHNDWEYGRVCTKGMSYEIGVVPPEGALVQTCVWKPGDRLEPRGKPKPFNYATAWDRI